MISKLIVINIKNFKIKILFMSSEVYKYIEEALEKNNNLFKSEVISFPKEKKTNEIADQKKMSINHWKISDKSNDDQLKAVMGVCCMFGALIVMGLYSNLL
tara:strand:+ start:463 stop:765 length:303 start_codon:yes stop_codon:yes gene_type:complete